MTSKTGEMAWLDLTVTNAKQVKDFYQQVVGWKSESVSMGEYDDYSMLSPITGDAVSGICHAKGANADLPATWIPYFLVEDINQSVAFANQLGGQLITEIKSFGNDQYVMIKDPAGAVCALYCKG